MTKELLSNSCDYDKGSPEFISKTEIKRIIMEAVRGRLESDGATVAPVIIRRRLMYDATTGQEWLIGPELEPVECEGPLIVEGRHKMKDLPNGNTVMEHPERTHLDRAIYNAMTGRCERAFSPDDINVLSAGSKSLISALNQAGYEKGGFELGQEMPFFQFGDDRSEDGELPPTRLYLHRTDLLSLQMVADLVNSGARPDYGKLWVPYNQEGPQRYRQDTLILGFSEYRDLKETIELLRERFSWDDGACIGAGETLYGLKVAGIPGAYIGQTKYGGDSFNGEMTQYFEEAIQRSCEDIKQPQTGEVLTDEWLDAMARKTTDILGSIMSKNGRTTHHALIDSDTTTDLIKLASGVQ